MCVPQLRVALVSLVCAIVFLSGCRTPRVAIGGSSEVQLAPDSYRVSFSPYGYISWDLSPTSRRENSALRPCPKGVSGSAQTAIEFVFTPLQRLRSFHHQFLE
jgi:hypothetical protein